MAEIIKFDRYVEQAKLLMKYRIDTWDQLDMFTEAVQEEIDALCNQRKALYHQKRSSPQDEKFSLQIQSINQSIQSHRRELKICARIKAAAPSILQKIQEITPAPVKGKQVSIHRCTRSHQR